MGPENNDPIGAFYVMNEDGSVGEKIPDYISEIKFITPDFGEDLINNWENLFEFYVYRPKACYNRKRFTKLMMSIGYSKREVNDRIRFAKILDGTVRPSYQYMWNVERRAFYRKLSIRFLTTYTIKLQPCVLYGTNPAQTATPITER